jgi:hypothetical protein
MSLDRRSFLKVAAAAPCIFGLRQFLVQEPDARPEWFKQALARMKERKLHGVVIIAPANEAEQLELGRRLLEILDADAPDAHELLLTGVFIVMTPALALSSGVRKAEEKDDRVLLDLTGRRIAADACGTKVFESPAEFATSFSPFLHGESGDRLNVRGEELSVSAPADVHKALVDLGAEDIETRDQAGTALLGRAGNLAPFYAWKRRTATDPEVAARLRSTLERHFKAKAKERPESRLPFGTREPKFTDGCGSLIEIPLEFEGKDYAVDCGMGRIDGERVRTFLRFLAK